MEKFNESRFYKAFNGGVGLTAVFFALLFFVVVIVIYLIRTCQSRKNLFNELYSYITGDAQNSTAKLLRSIIFLLLALGFVAVIYYNINKMLTDDPLVSVNVKDNKISPSILFCSYGPIEILGADYYEGLDDKISNANLTNSFNNNIIMGNGEEQLDCTLFNETLSTKPDDKVGGNYEFILSDTFFVFIGDFKDGIDRNRSFPQGSVHSNIGTQLITSDFTILTYEEIIYKELDGGKSHRSYQVSLIGSFPSNAQNNQVVLPKIISIIAPANVILNTEEPPLTLAVFFGNIGGYLTICGIFGFLFGSGKMSPFGFVTEYCFQYKDLDNRSDKVDDDFENDKEVKFETLLKKYYVDMENFESKNDSPV